MSANVSGYGQTMRITLNDNLLRRGSLEEIQSIMGHEMGHYVLHHIAKDILYFSVVIVIFFAFLFWSLERALALGRTLEDSRNRRYRRRSACLPHRHAAWVRVHAIL
jgi:Zn-dependent protease with chaperone function